MLTPMAELSARFKANWLADAPRREREKAVSADDHPDLIPLHDACIILGINHHRARGWCSVGAVPFVLGNNGPQNVLTRFVRLADLIAERDRIGARWVGAKKAGVACEAADSGDCD